MNSPGLMADITSAITLTTKRKAKECFTGQMAGNMTAAGKTENSMVLETIPPLVENPSKESGKRVRDCIGCNLTSEEGNLLKVTRNEILLLYQTTK